ncbi:MAG: tetratricopeptide repeat protein [Anaerolineales bacterium]|nr:tetratricopeptide repeat protein [Anaerolineales bacterium]
MSTAKPNPQFIQSIQAGLRYWQQKTETLEAEQVVWLDERRQNLHQAVLFGLNQSETWEDTVQVLLQAFDFSEWRGYWPEWIPVLEQALATAPDNETELYGRLQNRLGQLYRLDNRYPEAMTQHEQVLQLAKKLGNYRLTLFASAGLLEIYLKQRQIEQAEKVGAMALQLLEKDESHERLKAYILKNLAEVENFVGNWHKSAEYLQSAIQLFRAQGNQVYVIRCTCDLGVTYLRGQDFTEAQRAFEEAAQLLEGTTYEIDRAKNYMNLGVLFFNQQKWAEAAEAFAQINPIALREQREINLLAMLYNNFGNVYLKMAKWKQAEENLELAIEIFRQTKNDLELGNSLGTLATVYVALNERDLAKRCFEEALALLEQFPNSAWAKKITAEIKEGYHGLLKEEEGQPANNK